MAKMKKKSYMKLVKAGAMYSNLPKLRDRTELMDTRDGSVIVEQNNKEKE